MNATESTMARILSLFILALLPLFVQAQLRFTAQIPSHGEVNGQLRVQFTLNGAEGEGFTPPKFNDFEVLAGPSVSSFSNTRIENGRTFSQSSTTYTYILSPRHKGALTIGAASVRVGGKTLRTAASTVVVNGEAKAPKNNGGGYARSAPAPSTIQSSSSKIAPRDLYFSADLNKKVVYEQEAVMLTYRYHAREGIALAQISLSQKPELQGFWTQEIPESRNISPKGVNIGGRLYAVGSAFQYLVFPQQTGNLQIAPVTFTCDVAQQDNNIDEIDAFFNGGGMIDKKVQVTSPATQLKVLPLPTPKPQHFSGGVGQFQLTAQLISPQPRTNDIGTLRLTVTGTGNLKLIKAPDVAFPKDFDNYPAKVTDNVRITPEGVTGNMQFDYTFVPQNVGSYTIPSVQLVYFDPEKRSYVTAQTAPITLQILKGEKTREETNAQLGLSNSDILPIHPGAHESYKESSWNHFGTFPFFAALLALLASFVTIFLCIRHYLSKQSDIVGQRYGKAAKTAFKALQKLEKADNAGNNNQWITELKQLLLQYFADKFRCDRPSLTHQVLTEKLVSANYDEAIRKKTEDIMQQLDYLAFAPGNNSAASQTIFTDIRSLITVIENSSN